VSISPPHYIAILRPDEDGCYVVSFPDLPGVITAGDTLDEALEEAVEALAFAAAGWVEDTGEAFPPPRTLEEWRGDPRFATWPADAEIVEVPLESPAGETA
jgi:antitoxin HicB